MDIMICQDYKIRWNILLTLYKMGYKHNIDGSYSIDLKHIIV